ncbi:MAG: AAA family ATPase [Myxococcales bacterium]|nr:AAA family ATPase [Myxococcales bacterium]
MGAFDLLAPVAAQERSRVWRAVHRASGRAAAVELLGARAGEAFTHAVQGAAALDHPRIQRLYAYGSLPPEVAARAGVAAGTPFLVRAWVEAPTLAAVLAGERDPPGGAAARGAPVGWAAVRSLVLAVLDALAHAHARGVAHGAIEARHVLWARGGPVVVGFPASGAVGGEASAGGDLVAVGVLAGALLAGEVMPAGGAAWVERLAGGGFAFAADAAVALRALPGEEAFGLFTLPPAGDAGWATGAGPGGRAPLPVDTRERFEEVLFPLVDTGAALLKLRPARTAGRETERAWMWSALSQVVRGEGLRAVALSGAAGMGKSHLAGWLGVRAHELGLAVPLRANHAAGGGASMGVGPMLARFLDRRARAAGVMGRSGGERVEAESGFGAARLAGFEDRAGLAAALASGGSGRGEGEAEPVVFDRPDERYAVLAAALARLAADRPLVLHLDDVHWGEDALRFALYLLRRRPSLAVLIVATARVDALPHGSTVAALWRQFVHTEGVDPIRLGPLSPMGQAAQVRSMVRCAPALVELLVRSTAGSPLLAEETLRLWLASGALVESAEGAVLREAASAGLTGEGEAAALSGLEAVWLSRVDNALAAAEPGASEALELAAALGSEVDRETWAAACARAGLVWPERGITRLHAERLLSSEPGGRWRFVHPALCDAVARRARAGGRWVAWHGVAADAVAGRGDADLHRLAAYQAAAGRFAAAAETLVGAFEAASARADQAGARQALVQRAQMLGALEVPLDAGPWVQNRVLRARLARRFGRMEVALRSARRAEPQARAVGDRALHAEALIELGSATRLIEGDAAGWPILAAAVEEAVAAGDLAIEGRARFAAASCLNLLGRFDEAEAALRAALGAAEAVGDDRTQGDALVGLADIARRRGDLAGAAAAVSAAAPRYRRAGHRTGRAVVSSLLGDLARYGGDLEGAWQHYTESRDLYAAVDAPDLPTAECNLALVELARGADAAARARLVEAQKRVWGGHELRVIIHAVLLPCVAALGDWGAWDAHMAAVGPLLDGRLAEPDVAAVAALAAERAAAAGEGARAAEARRLAVAQYRALGRAAEAAAVAARG